MAKVMNTLKSLEKNQTSTTVSLRKNLLRSILLFSISIILILLIIDLFYIKHHQEKELEQQFQYIEDTTLKNISNSVWLLNRSLTQIQIDGIQSLNHISYVEVTLDNEIFASSGLMPNDNNIISRTYQLIYQEQDNLINLGSLLVIVDTANFDNHSIAGSTKFLLLDALLIFSLLFFISYIMDKKIFSHLEHMSNFMKDISHNGMGKEFVLERKSTAPNKRDELDVLVDTFNFQKNELTKTNEELSHSRDMFYKVFQSSHDAIIISDLETGCLIDVNKCFYAMYGFTHSDDIIGKTALELNIWADEEDRETLKKLLLKNGSIKLRESKFRKTSGELRDCLVSVEIIDLKGKSALAITVHDITESKRYQEEILHSKTRLHNLARKLENAIEQERLGISREIHDELGQSLTGFKIDLSWLKDRLNPVDDEVIKRIMRMMNNIDTTVDTIRRISSQLRPAVLDDLGLEAAIEWVTKDFSERTGIAYDLNIDCDELDINMERDTAIFRIYQEALTNIARHSNADNFIVNMSLNQKHIELKVADNGIGITSDQIDSDNSIGVIGMQERAANIGATINFNNIEPSGLEVHLISPIKTQTVLDAT